MPSWSRLCRQLTPMEDSFGINNVALVGGQPRTLGLEGLLQVFVDFRIDVVRRRTTYRLGKRVDELHLVDGLLIAIVDIDEVIQIIRSSDDTEMARTRLCFFDLTQVQADYILEFAPAPADQVQPHRAGEPARHPARRDRRVGSLPADDALLRKLVSSELADVAKAHGTPRRTVLLESAGTPAARHHAAGSRRRPVLGVAVLDRPAGPHRRRRPDPRRRGRAKHDAIVGSVRTTARGQVGVVTTAGRMVRLPPWTCPPSTDQRRTEPRRWDTPEGVRRVGAERAGCSPSRRSDRTHRRLPSARPPASSKRVSPDYPVGPDRMGDHRAASRRQRGGAAEVLSADDDLIFITAQAQLLRFPATAVRPQGAPPAGWPASGWRRRIASPSSVSSLCWGGDRRHVERGHVRRIARHPGRRPEGGPYAEYPPKGRGTGGVRAHRFLKGEGRPGAGLGRRSPARASAANGVAIELPAATGKQDGSGIPAASIIDSIAGPPRELDRHRPRRRRGHTAGV